MGCSNQEPRHPRPPQSGEIAAERRDHVKEVAAVGLYPEQPLLFCNDTDRLVSCRICQVKNPQSHLCNLYREKLGEYPRTQAAYSAQESKQRR